MSVGFLGEGPTLDTDDKQDKSFFDFLRTWGGEWMWSGATNEGAIILWVVDAI